MAAPRFGSWMGTGNTARQGPRWKTRTAGCVLRPRATKDNSGQSRVAIGKGRGIRGAICRHGRCLRQKKAARARRAALEWTPIVAVLRADAIVPGHNDLVQLAAGLHLAEHLQKLRRRAQTRDA